MMLMVEVGDPERVAVRLVREGRVIRGARAEGKGQTLRLVSRVLRAPDRSKLAGVVLSMTGGSFSHVRSAAAVANTLGFVLGVPALGLRGPPPGDADGLRVLASRLRRIPKTSIVRPAYRGEPNITLPRHG